MGPTTDARARRFSMLAMPHLDAAYNLARWLTQNDHDAQDVVQDALMRGMRYIDGFRGDNARAWLLQIVRHTCFSWLKENRPAERLWPDEDDESSQPAAPSDDEPPAIAMRKSDRQSINRAIAMLPIVYREVFVLRELEDLSYVDIARIADIPIGTSMSRLARGRSLMRAALMPGAKPPLRAVRRVSNGEGSA
ncbi:RNA polymerase sigma factor [soil metagenome]